MTRIHRTAGHAAQYTQQRYDEGHLNEHERDAQRKQAQAKLEREVDKRRREARRPFATT